MKRFVCRKDNIRVTIEMEEDPAKRIAKVYKDNGYECKEIP